MREDDTAVTQDDSGKLHAHTIFEFTKAEDKSIEKVTFKPYREWVDNEDLDFQLGSPDQFYSVLEDIVEGKYDEESVYEVADRFYEDGEEKSIAEKTGNSYEFGGGGIRPQHLTKEFSVDIYRVLPGEDMDMDEFGGNLLGYAIDFPNSDVYIEWNNKIFPDPLDDGHVSIYSSMKDLETATGNQTELVETISQPDTVEKYDRDIEFPVECRSCGENDRMEGSMVCEECKEDLHKQAIEGYPDLPTQDTPEEVINWLYRLDEEYNPSEEDEALLYQLLGSGTPEWKMSKDDADYKSSPEGDAYCGNCEYAYYSNQSGEFICSKVRGKVEWEGWCRLWDHAEPDELLQEEFGVPEGVEKEQGNSNGSTSGDKLLEKIIGGSYHRRRKIRQRGEQVSSECIDMLTQTHKQQVWPDRLQKSPSWESDDDVTGEIKQWVGAVIDMEDPMWDEYSNVPMAAGLTVKQHIKESLTQSQGWSLNSVSERLRKDFPQLSKFERERIARQEVSGVLNKSKMTAIAARKGDPLVRWVGPDDDDTTELCQSLSEATEDGVPFSEFTDMLVSHAKEYGGTPNRAESGLPHMQCRYTVEIVDE